MDYQKSPSQTPAWAKTTINLAKKVINAVLPPRCPESGDVVPEVGMISPKFWAKLQFIAAPYCSCCGIPFPIIDTNIEHPDKLLCGECLARTPPYHIARSALVYDDASRSLILGFKHGDKTHLHVTFGPMLAAYGRDTLINANTLIPVPLHWRRLLVRRYNQSALLCHTLSNSTGIPTWADALQRTRYTLPQGHKNAKDRHDNVKNAFTLNPLYLEKIKGKNCVLVDDVLTTGATIEECTKVLLNAGASDIRVLTIARVVRAS